MKKDEKLLFFLGKTQGLIESLAALALQEKNENLFEKISDLEQYFNEELATIFGMPDCSEHIKKRKESGQLGLMVWS